MSHDNKSIQHALGIDFGTSNSYFSDVRVGGLELAYTDLKFHNGQSSVPTCLLYQRNDAQATRNGETLSDEWEPCAFGDAAIELWKDLLDDERDAFTFRGGFKPDITFKPQAYRDAVHFFRSARKYLQSQRLVSHFSPENGRQVVVGVPARNIPGQEEKTLQALQEAGIYDALLVPEPEGALFYHLYYDRSRITVERAHQGVLVIDFGGGTFDAAYLRDGEVQEHWGNPMLGGRLFDDLFYQWFLDQQNGEDTRQEMLADGTLSYLRTFGFRRLKERFSVAWTNQQLERFRERITVGVDFDYGVFRNVTMDEFYERASHYRASPDLLDEMALLDDDSGRLLQQDSIDLMAELKTQLEAAHEHIGTSSDTPITAVILTGGSCRWPFMMEMTQASFPEAALFQSPDPEATISRGLALSYAFREYAKDVGTSLQEHTEELHSQLMDAISSNYHTLAHRIAAHFAEELYQEQIQPMFEEWRDQGGSIASLENKARDAAQTYFENEGQDAVEKEQTLFQERVEQVINESVLAWLRKHRVTRTEYLSLGPIHDMQHDELGWNTGFSDMMNDFFATTKWVISGLVGVGMAALTGGSGVAILMSGPLGWLLGLVVGAAATLTLLSNVETRNLPLPSWILKRIATPARLNEAQNKFKEEVERNLIDMLHNQYDDISSELEQQISKLVGKLSHRIPVTAIIDAPSK
ncbi:MAG: hypothetical protein EP343_28245 [Deltaproteobacteria bacterium]|nr:MAG: hypothetical protein EP343_28245 [Deltaproteobacteria bacterium]